MVGVLEDSFIKGVKYRVTSDDGSYIDGVTDENGTFRYFKDNDIVKFYIGDVKVGETVAKDRVTPVDIVGSQDSEEFVNLLILFQSLDSDNNPDNGIEIDSTTQSLVTGGEVELSSKDSIDALITKAQKNIVTKESAKEHFEESEIFFTSVSELVDSQNYIKTMDYQDHSKPVTWFDALAYCQAIGLEFPNIEKLQEYNLKDEYWSKDEIDSSWAYIVKINGDRHPMQKSNHKMVRCVGDSIIDENETISTPLTDIYEEIALLEGNVNCPYGGIRKVFGRDLDGDGDVDTVRYSTYSCKDRDEFVDEVIENSEYIDHDIDIYISDTPMSWDGAVLTCESKIWLSLIVPN